MFLHVMGLFLLGLGCVCIGNLMQVWKEVEQRKAWVVLLVPCGVIGGLLV